MIHEKDDGGRFDSSVGRRLAEADIRVSNVQYDGEGKWLDVHFSSGASYRLDVSFIVDSVVKSLRVQDRRVGLLTASGVLRWGEKDVEKV